MHAKASGGNTDVLDASIQTTFSEDQYDLAYPKGYESHAVVQALHRVTLAKLRKHVVPEGKILDVGCGLGVTVAYLRNNGLDCYGVELASPQIEGGIDKYVWTGTDCVDLDETFRHSVKAITLLQVIEHIPDPHEFTNRILQSFPLVDTILVTVPARMELWNNDDDYVGHLIRYDMKSLAGFAEAITDFRIEEMRYGFKSLYPILRVIQMLRGRNRSSELSPPKPAMCWLHTLAGYLFYLEEGAPPRSMSGPSLSLVLKRRPPAAV